MGVGNHVLFVFTLSGPGKVLTIPASVRHFVPDAEDTKTNEKDGLADLPKLRLEETDRDIKESLP